MKSIAFVVSTPLTINSFMVNHIRKLSTIYKVTVIANEQLGQINDDLPIDFIHIPFQREISPLNDFLCICKLYKVLRLSNFDAVHSITPKAGLIGMISSYLARVEFRFHTFTGQVWATKKGIFKWLLKSIDRLIFSLSTFSLVDSHSQHTFLLEEKVIRGNKSCVLGSGSISGVDIGKFDYSTKRREEIRLKYNIPLDAYVFIFLGRLCKDKGIDELTEAFQRVSKLNSNVYLLLVGPNEGQYDNSYFEKLGNARIVLAGLTRNPEFYFSASDVLVLPSYREGFGTTVLEAAACGIPTIASNIYGLSDAVVNGSTGLLHEVKNVESLTSCMMELVNNEALTVELGSQAKKRVKEVFSSECLSTELLRFYREHVSV
ncbi:glycosyltransferase family 4 protein [Vibrio parahaemolyticus]|uniref:glycosyltransferase family 4 protein n=1 Tax=Vibrio parahaemolyticus TaxID=670 RepID=UPI0014852A79|nr:glycosyltransferase family 4 protein [Vibrio parahaemolyticus]NNU10270.1 glycosyltransferase family 4 protein [Vibrio parahaemolyticus]